MQAKVWGRWYNAWSGSGPGSGEALDRMPHEGGGLKAKPR